MAKIKAETLLRKIQKGTANLKEKAGKIPSFSFNGSGGIKVFKRREIVQPYLHHADSALVNNKIKESVIRELHKLDPRISENYDKLMPVHLVDDVYSLYYNPSEKIQFEVEDKSNSFKFGILDSINNSLLKIVTNHSHISSYVYAEEISKFLYKKFMELTPEQQEKLKEALQNCNQQGEEDKNQKGKQGPKGQQPGSSGQSPDNSKGEPGQNDRDHSSGGRRDSEENESRKNSGEDFRGMANNSHGNNSKKDMSQQAADEIDRDLKKMVENLNSNQSKKELENALKKAEQKLEKLQEMGVDLKHDENMPEVEKKEIIANLNNLDSIRQSLSRLNTSKSKIMGAVKKILNNTTNYFSQKCIKTDVELFEADQILDINGIEYIHPAFRQTKILDLSITERHYIGKFDLYVDCSGSMGAGCGGNLGNVSRIDLAKSLAMQMKQLGILGDLYEFEDRAKKILTTDISILMMAARGGTNVENVLQNVLKTGNNSVILTDGESYINSFTEKALFIGIGTDFYYFKNSNDVGKKFVEDGQCIYYDGNDFVTASLETARRR